MLKKLLFIILITIGIGLRVYQVNTFPGGLFIDEVNMAVDAKSLAENGVDQYGRSFPFVFEDATDYKLPGYIYAAAISYKVFGPTLLAIRFPALLASLVSIFLLGVLVKLLFPKQKNLAAWSMVMVALSPFAIHFARIAYETTFATCFILVYLISLIKIIYPIQTPVIPDLIRDPVLDSHMRGNDIKRNGNDTRKKDTDKIWIVIGISALFIAMWTYPAPRFILPVFTILLLVAIWFLSFPEINKHKARLWLGVLFIINLITFIPSFLFASLDSRPLSYLTGNTDLKGFAYVWDRISSITTSLIRNWNLEFLFDKGVTFAYRHGTKENGIFLQMLFIPYLIGLWYSIKNISTKHFGWVFFLVFTLVAGFPSALTSETPYGTRIVPLMTISLPIIIAFGITWSIQWMGKKPRIVQLFCGASVAILFIYQMGLFAHIYFGHFRTTSVAEFTPAQTQLGLYIKQEKQKNPNLIVYFLNDHTCQNWGNDALHLWYFADLPNKDMIAWNNAFRTARYADPHTSPFDAYDKISPPTATVSGIMLFPGYVDTKAMPSGSLAVYCGIHQSDLNTTDATIVKIFPWLDDVPSDSYYVVSKKK